MKHATAFDMIKLVKVSESPKFTCDSFFFIHIQKISFVIHSNFSPLIKCEFSSFMPVSECSVLFSSDPFWQKLACTSGHHPPSAFGNNDINMKWYYKNQLIRSFFFNFMYFTLSNFFFFIVYDLNSERFMEEIRNYLLYTDCVFFLHSSPVFWFIIILFMHSLKSFKGWNRT